MSEIEFVLAAVLVVLSYLAGSIPVGYLVGRYVFKTDLFVHGSRSMGATNAFRVLGARAGAGVFLADLLKGIVPALVAGLAMPSHPEIQALAGLAAVVGHSWSFWVGLKGGRGVATAFGAALVIFPIAVLVAVPIGAGLVIFLRYVSLGSISGALASLGSGIAWYATGFWKSEWGLVFVAMVVTLILWQHRANMQRLARGTELRMAEWPTYMRSARVEDDVSGEAKN